MSLLHPEAEQLAAAYLGTDQLVAAPGSGIDGIVYSTSRATAVKVHSRPDAYARELSVYQ